MRKSKAASPISTSDQAFFQKFYEDNKKFMYYIAGQYTSSQADREDIVQDAIVRLIKNISTLRKLDGCKIAKYIVLTIRAAFLDNERRKHGSITLFLDDATLEALIKAEVIISGNITDIDNRLEVDWLKQRLAPRDWLVLEGKYIMGYSSEELGRMLGVAPDSVRMILSRAKKNARNILQRDMRIGGEIK